MGGREGESDKSLHLSIKTSATDSEAISLLVTVSKASQNLLCDLSREVRGNIQERTHRAWKDPNFFFKKNQIKRSYLKLFRSHKNIPGNCKTLSYVFVVSYDIKTVKQKLFSICRNKKTQKCCRKNYLGGKSQRPLKKW